MNILIGADPEIFAFHTADQKYVSAHTLIPGTKKKPHPVERGAVQRDGVAAEFNIDPVSNRMDFLVNIHTVMRALRDMVGDQYELRAVPTANFDQEYFDALPRHPKELGCTPDYNAYTGKVNSPPKTTLPFRTGAGHVHIGWGRGFDTDDPTHHMLCCRLVKQLDAVLFFASLLWDPDEKRRELYGNIGAFRGKSYGLEYRPMSNAWLNDPELILWVYDATVKATELFFQEKFIFEDLHSEEIRTLYLNKMVDSDDLINYLSMICLLYDIPALPEKYR